MEVHIEQGEANQASTASRTEAKASRDKLWTLLFDKAPPAPRKVNVAESAGKISRLLGREFTDEELAAFLESEE